MLFCLQKRNDRKEILRRLAMGSEYDQHNRADKPLRKPSLHSRLQGGQRKPAEPIYITL